MNKRLPAFISAALILFSGCSYYSVVYDEPVVTRQYISEYPSIQQSYELMEIPQSDEIIPQGLTNKHIARISKTDENGETTVIALYSYDTGGREIACTNGKYTVKKEYDELGAVTLEEKYIDGVLSSYIEYKYDDSNRLVSSARYTAKGKLIYGEDTFDLEYDSKGRVVSKCIYASSEGELRRLYYQYDAAKNRNNPAKNPDGNTLSVYTKTYADGGDYVVSEKYEDYKLRENNYLFKYDYKVGVNGALSVSVTDSATGVLREERSYETGDLSRLLDTTQYDKNGMPILLEGYEYSGDGSVVVYAKIALDTDNSGYNVELYVYDEKESGFFFDVDSVNVYEIIGKDTDDRIHEITVFRDYDNKFFNEIRVYNNSGECIKKSVCRRVSGRLISYKEYDNSVSLVSRIEYANDSQGNILSAKRYEGDALVETITYDYQVIPGAFCEPYTVEPGLSY